MLRIVLVLLDTPETDVNPPIVEEAVFGYRSMTVALVLSVIIFPLTSALVWLSRFQRPTVTTAKSWSPQAPVIGSVSASLDGVVLIATKQLARCLKYKSLLHPWASQCVLVPILCEALLAV
jgi:hypothetical protein